MEVSLKTRKGPQQKLQIQHYWGANYVNSGFQSRDKCKDMTKVAWHLADERILGECLVYTKFHRLLLHNNK